LGVVLGEDAGLLWLSCCRSTSSSCLFMASKSSTRCMSTCCCCWVPVLGELEAPTCLYACTCLSERPDLALQVTQQTPGYTTNFPGYTHTHTHTYTHTYTHAHHWTGTCFTCIITHTHTHANTHIQEHACIHAHDQTTSTTHTLLL